MEETRERPIEHRSEHHRGDDETPQIELHGEEVIDQALLDELDPDWVPPTQRPSAGASEGTSPRRPSGVYGSVNLRVQPPESDPSSYAIVSPRVSSPRMPRVSSSAHTRVTPTVNPRVSSSGHERVTPSSVRIPREEPAATAPDRISSPVPPFPPPSSPSAPVSSPASPPPARPSYPGASPLPPSRPTVSSAPPTRPWDPGPVSAPQPKVRKVLLVSEDQQTIGELRRLFLRMDAELVVSKTLVDAGPALDATPPPRPPTLIMLDGVLRTNRQATNDIMGLQGNAWAGGARIIVIGSFSAQTLEELRREWSADDVLSMSRGLLHVDACIRQWLDSSSPPRARPSSGRFERAQRPEKK